MRRFDTLPKCICTDCWHKIEEFHNFHRSVLNAQDEYLKRAIKSEIEREPDNACSSHEVTKPPNFVEVITNCEEFNEFADETIKASDNDLGDNNQQEVKLQEFDEFCNDTASDMEDDESIRDDDDGDNDFYKEENEDEMGKFQLISKHTDELRK